MVTMHIDTSKIVSKNGKVYVRHLLRDSYKENGKTKHHTIANLSKCSEAEIAALKYAMRNKHDLTALKSIRNDLRITQGKAIGAVFVLYTIADRLGITKALGNSREGKLALWQILSRVIDQGSRLSSVRLANLHAFEFLGLDKFNEDDLYKNLSWLSKEQEGIEDYLFKKEGKKKKPTLFLYDVTSSYLEGEHNELAQFGYNRDGKKGKKQIVIGLLCDEEGTPLSVEVFEGNTNDCKTVYSQIKKAANRFGVEEVTFVGDRGMLKSTQTKELKEHNFHYITAITKKQIDTLMNNGYIQLDLFDSELAEIERDGERYILRRNPMRQQEIASSRENKLMSLRKLLYQKNEYLALHKKAKLITAINNLIKYAAKLKIQKIVKFIEAERYIEMTVDEDVLKDESLLDGCYVIKTDLPNNIDKKIIHSRYKDLAKVEEAFRTSKTAFLEMRPIHVRTEESTRGHIFVVMLAYRIARELSKYWRDLDVTAAEGINHLSLLSLQQVKIDNLEFCQLTEPNEFNQKLLSAAKIKLPRYLPLKNIEVATRKKLPDSRKSL